MKRALVLIDAQNESLHGALPIAWPPAQSGLERMTAAMDAATAAAIPVVVVRQVAPVASPIFSIGSRGADLCTEVAERPFEHLVDKTLPSAFTGTDLEARLRGRPIDRIAIAGWMTQNCDESTARDALHFGFEADFLFDATWTLPLENEAGSVTARVLHESVLVTMQSRFAHVCSTQQWIQGSQYEGAAPSGIYSSTARARAERAGVNSSPARHG